MLNLTDFSFAKWILLPGVELRVQWRGSVIVVYYLIGERRSFDSMVRTWHADELDAWRATTGLALTVGQA